MEIKYFLGIDAGGSRCKARLANLNGDIIGRAETGPANARIGLDKLKLALVGAAEKALADARLEKEELSKISAGLGIAGISRPGVRELVEAMELPFAKRKIDTDAAVASIGAHNGKDGAVLILGTGSIGFIRVGDKETTIGGYGFPISDEGSGAALGLSAMRHALRALDGRTKPTPLSAAVTEQFGHDTTRVIAWMDSATPRDYAAFAPMVLDYAEKNDEIARSIVEDAAKHVERFIETIFAKGAPRCALAGGVAPRLTPWLRERTTTRLCEAMGDPLDGALILAGLKPRRES